ncbi:MAG TPA: cytochrome c biogenesis CcdA family protein [Burkholderiales bacterium]|nr:cytochrome c biogenesis CcdA family protein [Burkholderiales bacterium]HSE00063.1 cytochrome c biogenesis CcdA family protein [Burkholderiales bacterium]
MSDLSGLGMLTAFAAGLVSFLSPCVLPLVPSYVSYVAGERFQQHRHLDVTRRLSACAMSGMFVAGFSTVFLAFGASASALGQLLMMYRYEANIVGGAIIIVFGLLMLGMPHWLPWLQRDMRFHPHVLSGHPLSAFTLGLAFGFGWTPCIGPVLGAILTLSAVSTTTGGVGLLGAYALGLGVPFLASALFLDRAARLLREVRRLGQLLQVAGGLLLIALGIAMITGWLTAFSFWLIDTFPAFRTIG